jgi:hypothetical protein
MPGARGEDDKRLFEELPVKESNNAEDTRNSVSGDADSARDDDPGLPPFTVSAQWCLA